MSKFIIYALVYDASNRLYVGKSCSGLSRPAVHSTNSAMQIRPHSPVTRWINKYRNISGQRPTIVVLEEFEDGDSLSEAEMFYIAYFRSIGMQLLNSTEGGEGTRGHVKSQETRNKLSISSTRAMSTPEARERSAAPNRGRRLPEVSRKAIAEKLSARPMTKDWTSSLVKARDTRATTRVTARMRLAAKIGDVLLSDWRADRGLSLIDAAKTLEIPLSSLHRIEKKEPAESRARAKVVSAEKISIVAKRAWAAGAFVERCNSQRGQKRPEEVCQKMRGRRRKFSDETREKMSRSARLRGKPRVRINLLRAA